MRNSIIIGGGVAGLVAAIQLAERGLRPVVLDADPTWIGGRLRGGSAVELVDQTGKQWSFPSEHGVHGIWSPYVNLKTLLERHQIMPTLVPSNEETWIFGQAGKVRKAAIGSAIHSSPVPAPFHYLFLLLRPRFLSMLSVWDFLSLVRVEGTLFSAMAIDPLAEGRALDGMTLADFTRGWTPTIRSLFAGLARNALAAHPEAVPVAGFIAFLRFYTLLRRDSWKFSYLPGTGGECIVEPLSRVAQNAGCVIKRGCRVTRLENKAGEWSVVFTDAHGQQQEQQSDHVVLALDAPSAHELLLNSPSTATAAAALRFPEGVPTLIVRLWFRGMPQPIASSGICTGDFLVDNFFWLHQIQPVYQQWHQATGGSAVEMHVYGPSEVLAQPDATLLARVIHDTYRAFPELRGSLLHSVVVRNAATHTLFTPGDPARSLAVQTPWPRIVACGDWINDPNPAMYLERATTTGMVAANHVLRDCGLEPWPIAAHPEPEWFAGKLSSALTRFRLATTQRRRVRQHLS